ncbi:MAG: (Fe-S)-binding protein [Dehalococcoidia bacterium]|nr:(Fe-S)-binding protein [Dehalococcoidia bacterium]
MGTGKAPLPYTKKQLMELDGCTRCGECLGWCQAYGENKDLSIAPAERLRAMRRYLKGEKLPSLLARLLGGRKFTGEDLKALSNEAYLCTLCGRCEAVCPVGIGLRDLWIALREDLVERGLQPAGLNMARDAAMTEHNILSYPNDERATWVDYMMEAPEDLYQRPTAEVVYFVGCIASFSPAVQSIPEAFVQLLTAAGVDFTIMGGDEWCCGLPLIAGGMRKDIEELKKHNIAAIMERGAKRIVFTCPSCYNTWLREYAPALDGVELLHSTQFIRQLLAGGKLELKETAKKVTYHDPCDLGRNSGVYDEPREILKQMPGVQFVEMRQNRERGLCCGGGGDLEISSPELAGAEASSFLRAIEALNVDAVVTACQQCKRMIKVGITKEGARIEAIDIAEFVFGALRGS